jgi:hypothetical protein
LDLNAADPMKARICSDQASNTLSTSLVAMTERAVAPLDQDSARTALDELFTLARKYNSSHAYLELMRFVGRFRFYSSFNAVLIYTQMPGAHFVCTALRWRRDYHREIKIGARPIVILQPMGPILLVFDVSDTAPLPNARPLPLRVESPFQVQNGKIGGQLALTRSATECESPNVPTVRSERDPSKRPQQGSIWNLQSRRNHFQNRLRSLSGSSSY